MNHDLKTLLKVLKEPEEKAPRWIAKEYVEALMKELRDSVNIDKKLIVHKMRIQVVKEILGDADSKSEMSPL